MIHVEYPTISHFAMTRKALAVGTVIAVAAISALATWDPRIFSFIRSIPMGDKIGHFTLFGFVTYSIVSAIPGKRSVLYGASITAIIVLLEESLQIYSPNRTFSFLDLSASLLGVAVVSSILYLSPKKSTSPNNHIKSDI